MYTEIALEDFFFASLPIGLAILFGQNGWRNETVKQPGWEDRRETTDGRKK